MSALSPFQALSGTNMAFGLAMTFYNMKSTADYRSKVVSKLAEIEKGIEDLENTLKALIDQLKVWELWDKAGNPMEKINGTFAKFEVNDLTTIDDKKALSVEIDSAMMEMYRTICGKIEGFENAAVAFMTNARNFHWEVPLVEVLYQYYTLKVIPTVLKGYSLLLYLGDTDKIKNWYTYLTTGYPDASEEYLKGSFIKYMGGVFQAAADLDSSDFPHMGWAGLPLHNNDNRAFDDFDVSIAICDSEITNVPENHVLFGYDFCTDSGGRLDIKAWHGPVGADGYMLLDKEGKPQLSMNYSEWKNDHFCGEKHSTIGNSDFMDSRTIMDTGPVTAPEGHVVMNIRLSLESRKGDWGGTEYCLYPEILVTPLNNGNVTWAAAFWVRNPDPSWEEFCTSADDPRKFWHWSKADGKTPSPEWTVPLTGVWIDRYKATFRADIHKNCFAYSE